MERAELPLYVQLYEKKGESTNKLVDILRNSINEHGVDTNVKLENITDDPENNAQNLLIYSISYDINNKREGEAALNFLKYLFKTYYDNFPSYVEPI